VTKELEAGAAGPACPCSASASCSPLSDDRCLDFSLNWGQIPTQAVVTNVWNDVHTAALEDYGISGADLFYPGWRHE
jgi:hypothetical protein